MNIERTQRATVWDVKKSEHQKNVYVGFITTYEGKDRNDNPQYSRWNARFVGGAAGIADQLQDGDKIVLDLAKVETRYDKEKKVAYTDVTIFDFDWYEPEEKPAEEEPKKKRPAK